MAPQDGELGNDSDVFLLCKHFMHSSCLTQKPTLLLPASRLGNVGLQPTQTISRNKLSDRQLAEFRKTARQIAEPPWSLLRASDYLNRLCDDNASEKVHDPPPLVFFNSSGEEIDGFQALRDRADPPEDLLNFAPGTPRKVVVNLQPRGRGGGGDAARGRPARGRGRGRGRGRRDEGDNANGEAPAEAAMEPPPGALEAEAPPVPPAPRPAPKRGLKRPAAAPPRGPAAKAAAAAPEPGQPSGEAPAAPGEGEAGAAPRYRQSTIDKQSKLGCNKCKYAVSGCTRCKEIHSLYRAQHGLE